MKTKLILVIVLALFVRVTDAQTFGIKGGVNIANMTISAMGMGVSQKPLIGIHVGPVMDFQLKGNLCFNTGLLYSMKGFKVDTGGSTGSETLNYLVVPLNLAYKFPIKDKSKFFIQAGPYLGYALSGKDKADGQSTDIVFGSGGMKRFDIGVGFGAGVEFGSVVTSVNYELGLQSLIDEYDVGAKAKNKVFQISIAYMFGKAR